PPPASALTRRWYFDAFEERRPRPPMPYHAGREFALQATAFCAVILGVWYLSWRFANSVNWDAWYLGVPLVVAETLAFFGTILFFATASRTGDTPPRPPPARLSEIQATEGDADRKLVVDIFFPTYNEDPELVRLSLRDAKRLTYPHDVELCIHVLDDGKRADMRRVADEEQVHYITRPSNAGYKAGNLRNALEHTHGDLLVICDADTRVFPRFLEATLGYFRDPKVAWVQTPQWFYDLDEGTALPDYLARRLRLGRVGRGLGRAVEAVAGAVRIGRDPLGNDPEMFYDVILRRRNWANASFCCGAGSVHRREAVMEAALKAYAEQVARDVSAATRDVTDPALRRDLAAMVSVESARGNEITPYKFHVSEDIYTSIILHSDRERGWTSVFHAEPLSKMLSPQDLLAWTIQRFKYAGGTLDIAKNDSPLRRPLSRWQKLMYGTTIYSYLAPLWTMILLVMPAVYFFTGISAVTAYDAPFYGHIVPFLVVNRIAFMLATWGVDSWRGEQYYLAFFWTNLKALLHVARGLPVKFHVTPKVKQSGNFAALVLPQLAIVTLTVLGILVRGLLVLVDDSPLGPFVVNVFWGLWNVSCLMAMISVAFHKSEKE
ncbi:MAG TPA: glycosyltransferase, partial [Kofleriaceae bacterium]|nr:glycosyltransferase [Kofleriaceae bacterium]